MLFYRAALPLSSRTLNFVARIIRRYRKEIGSLWRRLDPGQQALQVLAYLEEGRDVPAGHGRVRRRDGHGLAVRERDRGPARGPRPEAQDGCPRRQEGQPRLRDRRRHLIAIDRVARDKQFYSGKHKRHGVNLQVIASPAGDVLWVSGGLPGHVHDKKAEWIWGVLDELEKAGVVVLADRGYQGAAHAHLPYKKRKGGEAPGLREGSQPRPRPSARPR